MHPKLTAKQGIVTVQSEGGKILGDNLIETNREEYTVSPRKELNTTADQDLSVTRSGIVPN